MNHYETLGVTPEATADEVKRAFRKKAGESHPDREGGSTELMQSINKAYAVLGDPEKRAHYDATGQDNHGLSIEDEARTVLMQLFSSALDGDVIDVLANVRQTLQLAASNLARMQNEAKSKREKLVKRTGKVRAKQGDNLVQMLIDQKCNDLAQLILHMDRGLKINKAATAMLDAYEADPPPSPVFQQQQAYQTTSATGGCSWLFGRG